MLAERRCLLFVSIMVSFSATALSEEELSRDFREGLRSWNRMKRDAGYYTENGVWKGGLWRLASYTEREVYHCMNITQTGCGQWSLREENRRKIEYGTCLCAETEQPYCQQWNCLTSHISKRTNCRTEGHSRACYERQQDDALSCSCEIPAENRMYCSQWKCSERTSDGYSEEEDYQCLTEDVGGQYCYQWRGNASSRYAIESSFCQCFDRGERFCKYWECRERTVIRCRAHFGGWCRLEVGVFVGGGFGLLFLLLCGCAFRYEPNTRCFNWLPFVRCLSVMLHIDECEDSVSSLRRPGAFDCFRVWRFCIAIVLLCLPWLSGVLIWGGVDALIIVLPIWFFVTFEFLRLDCATKRRNRTRQTGSTVEISNV